MIFLFDKFKKLKGTVRNRHTISLLYERERNGLYTVSAEIPLKITDKKTVYNYHKKVQDSDFLGHYDREGRFQLHKIASVDIEDSSIFIRGVHLFFDEAKAGAVIQERRFRDSEIVDGARAAFDPIGWSVVDADVSDRADYIFYNVTPLEARAILVETFDYEFDYWLDFDGKNIRNKQISVKREMGKDSNKRYNYGHNVLNIKVEQDYSEIYTAVIGRGKGEDLGDDAYGRRIEYTDVEWKTPSNPMNKPLGSRILHDENATQLFGYHENGKVSPRTKVEIFDDIEDPAKLLRASYNWLRENSVPKAVFSLEVPDGDGLDLGDKVHVIYRDIDLVKHTRVTKVVDDLVSGNRDVEFGDTAYFKTDRRLSGVKSELKRVGGSMSSRISRLKAEFDKRFDDEVQQWHDDFEQAVIDAEAGVEAMRAEMTEEFETAHRTMTEEFNQSVADAKKHADDTADAKAKQVQDNLDSFEGRHNQLVGELQGNIVDIDGELEEARADVSGILSRLTGVDGSISGIEGSLSDIEGTLTNTKTQLENQVADARADLEKSISNTRTALENKIGTTEEALNKVGEDLGSAKTDLQKQLDDARAELDGLEVGGRNLLPNFNSGSWETFHSRIEILDDYTLLNSGDNANSIIGQIFVDVEPNTEYTISSYTDYGRTNVYGYIDGEDNGVIFHYIVGTFSRTFNTGDSNQIRISLGRYSQEFRDIIFRHPMLTRGNVKVDWTPALEDTEQKISAINKLVEENQASIATAEHSISTAEQKIEEANGTLAEHGSSISTQAVSIENIEGTLSTKATQSELDDVKGTVTQHDTSIKQNATEIASKADSSTVDTLNDTVTTQGTLLTQTAEEVATKASQSEVDTLTGTVTSQGTSITQNATEIASKADSSVVDALDETVTKQGTTITQNSNEIASKADSSVVDALGETVSNHGTSITQNANEIASKADSSVVNALKGTVTEHGTSITQNSEEIASKADSSVVNALNETVTSQGTTITQNSEEIATRATKTELKDAKDGLDSDLNTVNQTLSNHETSITQNAESIQSKADSSELNALEGTVTTQGTLLTQTAGELSSKAEKSVVDTLTGRVANTESSVTQNAEEIAKKLTKSDYDEDKKATDAKITQWTNTATETAEGLERVIGRVSETENGVETAQTRIEAEAGRIDGVLSRTSKVEGKVQDAELAIEANADGLALRATKTEVEQTVEDIDASISGVTDRVTTAEAELVVHAGEISQKATQSELDRVTGRVSTAETSITQNAHEIARRLVKSDYDSDKQATEAEITKWSNLTTETAEGLEQTISRLSTEEGKISKAQADIIANADEIALKATQSDLDSVTGRVSTAESQLSVQAGQIALRATKKELEGVDGRVSATESALTVLDDEISSVVGRVSGNETDISSVVQDISSITSTVATLEGDVASQGSKIEQTEDVISSKVWVDDVADIGANLVPTSPNAWEDGSYWSTGNANDNLKENIRLKEDLAVSTYRDVQYTFTCDSRERSNIRAWMLVNYDTITGESIDISIPFGQSRTLRTIGNRIVLTAYPSHGENVSISGFENNPTTDIRIKLEEGGSATPILKSLSHIEQKADEVSIKVSELGSVDGESLLTQSDISVRADRILLGSQEIGAETLSSIISVSPRSIDMITDNLNLTGNLNAKGQIESISVSAVRGDIAYLKTNILESNSINADMIQSEVISAKHINVTNALVERIISRYVFANEVKALSIEAVEADIGSIRSKILTSDVIQSSHINSSNALIDKIFANSARFERMMAKSGFVRTLNTVTIDTDQITIRRPDGARLISNGVLENTFAIQFIQPRFEGVGVEWSANYFKTTNTSYTTAAAFSYLRGGRYLTVEGYCEMRSAVSGSANTTEGNIRILEYSSGNRSSFATIENRATNNGGNQFFRIRIDMGVPQYEQRNFYVQFRTLHSGNAAHFRINQAYYHG